MFENLQAAPPDAIMGLTEAFKKDPNPNKINLTVGVFKDASGKTPVLEAVKEAEKRILEEETTKSYVGIEGSPEYAAVVQALTFGVDHEVVRNQRAATVQTPGGTGALRVAGDFLKRTMPGATIWLSDPTWANHAGVFGGAGFECKTYPYYDPETSSLSFEAMAAALAEVPAGDVVLLHACCHNPTGMDPDPEQWRAIADIPAKQGWLPLIDFAYHGFAQGIEEDTEGVRTFLRPCAELLICSSFSKNFGLYRERVGALTVVAGHRDAAENVLSNVKKCIRVNYSNPPSHGAEIVVRILNDPQLRERWEQDVAEMRDRINRMRAVFVETLKAKGAARDFSFLTKQTGMFSLSGLTKKQVDILREEYSIYIVGSGRINVAGMTEENMARLCEAIVEVLERG